MDLKTSTFADLIQHGKCIIKCLMSGEVVRTLTPNDDGSIHMLAGDGTELTIQAETPITYESWDMDRGSLIFAHPDYSDKLKICTELDILVVEATGAEFSVVPATGGLHG